MQNQLLCLLQTYVDACRGLTVIICCFIICFGSGVQVFWQTCLLSSIMPPKGKLSMVQEDGPQKADFSVFIMAMKAGALKGDKLKSELWSYYSGLSRFDKEKGELVKKFMADKACNWWVTYSERMVKTKSTLHTIDGGWASRQHIFV